ncbi:thioredoxin family protein [Magnetofaba australis]|uniref:Putative thioredoxin domain-containing protein n=1 Tax=Magnetofaba australis IT-1 TaxID=1434232 RepID=A0A1Y2K2P9_9PROT|nr:co-chaperone YbbN [Magnetofaba australis]OSM02310.1 putative thioredoxin domain-containing protein [Magnetofaba australis IT-1]
MAASQWVIDVDETNFVTEVLHRSQSLPVLVDFWAPWCQPCRTLSPILEKIAEDMNGRFLLAKIDSDQNQSLAQQFQVRGIPAVKLVIDGQVVDEFTGALPESRIREFLDKAIPSEADKMSSHAALLAQHGRMDEALNLFQAALEAQPDHAPSICGAARILLENSQHEAAKAVLGQLCPSQAESPEAKAIHAKLAFADAGGDLHSLRAQVDANPDDLTARLTLGQALVASDAFAEGMDQFLEILKRDRAFEDDAGRKQLIQTFEMLGHTHPLTIEYRGKLSAHLFS